MTFFQAWQGREIVGHLLEKSSPRRCVDVLAESWMFLPGL